MADNKEAVFTKFPELSKEIQFMIWEAAMTSPRVVEVRQKRLKKSVCEWDRENCPEGCAPRGGMRHISEDSESRVSRLSRWFPLLDFNSVADLFGDFGHISRREAQFSAEDLSEEYRKIEERLMDNPMPGITTRSPPQIFFTCRDSYEVVSTRYQKILGTAGAFAETYFDPQQDTLYLRYHAFSYSEQNFGALLAVMNTVKDKESLKIIRNLAVLLDLESLDDSYRVTSLNIDYRLHHLLESFSNLTDLTLVLQHYGDYESAEDPCVLLEPFTINGDFKSLDFWTTETSIEQNTRVPSFVQVDLAKLEARRS